MRSSRMGLWGRKGVVVEMLLKGTGTSYLSRFCGIFEAVATTKLLGTPKRNCGLRERKERRQNCYSLGKAFGKGTEFWKKSFWSIFLCAVWFNPPLRTSHEGLWKTSLFAAGVGNVKSGSKIVGDTPGRPATSGLQIITAQWKGLWERHFRYAWGGESTWSMLPMVNI